MGGSTRSGRASNRTRVSGRQNGYLPESSGDSVSDLPDDQHLDDLYPNPHPQNGVQIANVSDTTRSTFAIKITPDRSRARNALTACGGFRTDGTLAYDFRTSVRWKRERLLDSDRHYGTGTGRGEWSLEV